MAKEKKEVAVKDDATKDVVVKPEAGALVDMSAFEQFSGQGFEGADKDSYAIPFLRILQVGSPQVNEDEPSYIEGAKPGMFFNTITGEVHGKELTVIPISYSRSFIEWKPNRGGFVKDHGNNPAILDRIIEIDEKHNSILDNGNNIQDTRTHTVLLADNPHGGPIILSMTSTGIKHSRKWMTLMSGIRIPNSNQQAPMFACVWKIGTVKNENDDGKWYQIGDKSSTNVTMETWVNQEQLDASVACNKLISGGKIKADWDSTVDSERSNNSGSGRTPGVDYDEDGKPNIPF